MKILVIGGGMAGLTYSVVALKNGMDVTIAERNIRLGKKIAMSGNGKCNIGNVNANRDCYNKSGIVKSVLGKISVLEYVEFLKSCGVYTYADKEGRMYPLCESATNVVDCLRNQVTKFGGKVVTESVNLCRKKDGKFDVKLEGKYQTFDKVVVAVGSPSQAERPNIFGIVPLEYYTNLVPSLVPVKILTMDGILTGIRARADVTLFDGDFVLGKESGEVLFKDYGLSGICIFNLSSIIARRQVNNKFGSYRFSVDLVPGYSQWDLADILYARLKAGEPAEKLFYGILHNKVAECILRRSNDKSNATQLAYIAKNLTFAFDKLLDWSMSQVTAGGIDERYVNLDNLTLPNGIIALGEVLNVDGVCGGNNLFFAAASALYTFTEKERQTAYSKY